MANPSRFLSLGRTVALQALRGVNLARIRHYFSRESAVYKEVHRFYGWLFCLIVGHTLPIETVQNGQRIFRIEFDLSTFIKGTEFKPEDIQVTGKMGEVIIKARSEHYADVDNVRFHLKNDGFLVVEVPLPQIEAKADQEMPQE